jgi:hypothetical protein
LGPERERQEKQDGYRQCSRERTCEFAPTEGSALAVVAGVIAACPSDPDPQCAQEAGKEFIGDTLADGLTGSLEDVPNTIANLINAGEAFYRCSADQDPDDCDGIKAAGATVLGGIYVLITKAGLIKNVGITNKFSRREAEHALDPKKGGLDFVPRFIAGDREVMRGIEQAFIDELHPVLNKNNSIGQRNAKGLKYYADKVKDYLERCA